MLLLVYHVSTLNIRADLAFGSLVSTLVVLQCQLALSNMHSHNWTHCVCPFCTSSPSCRKLCICPLPTFLVPWAFLLSRARRLLLWFPSSSMRYRRWQRLHRLGVDGNVGGSFGIWRGAMVFSCTGVGFEKAQLVRRK